MALLLVALSPCCCCCSAFCVSWIVVVSSQCGRIDGGFLKVCVIESAGDWILHGLLTTGECGCAYLT